MVVDKTENINNSFDNSSNNSIVDINKNKDNSNNNSINITNINKNKNVDK